MNSSEIAENDELLEDEIQDSTEEEYLESAIQEEIPLTTSKILSLVGIGIVFFILFAFLLFPLNELIKSYLIDFSKNSGIIVEFKELRFSLLGTKSIDSLLIQPGNDMFIRVEELSIDTKILQLFKYTFDGEFGLINFRFESGEIAFLIKSVLLDGKLAGLDQRLTRYTGDINLHFRGGEITSLPELPMVGEIQKIEILQGSLKLKIRSGKVLLDQGNLNTSWFRILVSGQIRLNDNLGFSTLDLKICAQAQEKFAQERPDIAGLVALLPQENGKGCLPVQGTFRSPKIEIPGMMQVSPGSNSLLPGSEQGGEPGGVSKPPSSETGTSVRDGESYEYQED